jgi:hypothetical protein
MQFIKLETQCQGSPSCRGSRGYLGSRKSKGSGHQSHPHLLATTGFGGRNSALKGLARAKVARDPLTELLVTLWGQLDSTSDQRIMSSPLCEFLDAGPCSRTS